jgi:hypothetical protein
VQAGLKREPGDVGRRCGRLSWRACARINGSLICGKMGQTGQAHDAEARARARGERFGADWRAGAGACCAWWAERQRERGG